MTAVRLLKEMSVETAQIVMNPKCPQCNKVNGQNHRFCSGCGNLLDSSTSSQKIKNNNSLVIAVASLVSLVFACGMCSLFGAVSDNNQNSSTTTNQSSVEKPIAKPKPSIVNLKQSENEESKENKSQSTEKKTTPEDQQKENQGQLSIREKAKQEQPSVKKSKPRPSVPRNATSNNGLIRGPKGGCYYINKNGKKTYVDRSKCN